MNVEVQCLKTRAGLRMYRMCVEAIRSSEAHGNVVSILQSGVGGWGVEDVF